MAIKAIPKLIYTSPLSLHNDVKEDLSAIKIADPIAYAKIAALIRQLRADCKLAEKLLDHGFGEKRTEELSVSKWFDVWKQGKDLWRLKSWELEDQGLKYRIIYLYLRNEARFVVMAIVKRENFDYDDHEDNIRRRICASLQRTYDIH
ncbi:hypothetical protein [Polaromonas glacialis]|uniref:hypothetical protein n=1 Tax=Polaromonas glacialis TaxID=866564 RepID=UPI0018DC9BA0|nr:hypothetical protein [Polaromonas glacialis]